jgi:hypothetical protein
MCRPADPLPNLERLCAGEQSCLTDQNHGVTFERSFAGRPSHPNFTPY